METSSKAVESSWDRQITSIYLTTKIRDLKYLSKKVPMRGQKKLTKQVAYRDVENLDHQNWQLLEGKSYITSISIIKQKISYKNGVGSGFRRKIELDGGIQKKKRRESGIWEPLLWTLKGGGGCTQATALATFGLWHGMATVVWLTPLDWSFPTQASQRHIFVKAQYIKLFSFICISETCWYQ